MTAKVTAKNTLLRQEVLGSRRLTNYFWAVAAAGGGLGFLLAGLSSYTKTNLLLVSDTTALQFIPQGAALTFYGVAGLLVSTYLFLLILWDVGGGYNEFDKEKGSLTIFRSGFPGKNRSIEINGSLEEIRSVRAEIKEGLNPKRAIYLKLQNRRDIPLTKVGQPIALSELENEAAKLARFLEVPLEGL